MIQLLSREATLAGTVLAAVLAVVPTRAIAQQRISLDGNWSFVTDPRGQPGVADLSTAPGARAAQVPGSWQSEFADLRDYAGVAWYWRTFTTASITPGRAAIIRFGAVDYRATVYV